MRTHGTDALIHKNLDKVPTEQTDPLILRKWNPKAREELAPKDEIAAQLRARTTFFDPGHWD